jgi:hypothetical protein
MVEHDRLVEVLQPVLAELGEVAIDEHPRGRGENDLAAVARCGDPGGAVQLPTGIALAGEAQRAGVQADPRLDRPPGERLLTLRRCGQRLDGISEGIQEGVSLRIDLDTAVGGEGDPQETAVLGKRQHVPILSKLLDQPRRALDVGEQQGDGAARKLDRSPTCLGA